MSPDRQQAENPYAAPVAVAPRWAAAKAGVVVATSTLAAFSLVVVSMATAVLFIYLNNVEDHSELDRNGMPPEMVDMLPGWRGSEDLPAFFFLSLGLAIAQFLAVALIQGVVTRSAIVRALIAASVSFWLAVGWVFVTVVLLGAWAWAFSFPIWICWIVGAVASSVSAIAVGHLLPGQERSR